MTPRRTASVVEDRDVSQLLFVELKVSTSGARSWPDDMQGMGFDFSAYDFSIIGSDGLTEHELDTFATYGCLPDGELLPIEIGPGENVVGTIVLDTANPTVKPAKASRDCCVERGLRVRGERGGRFRSLGIRQWSTNQQTVVNCARKIACESC